MITVEVDQPAMNLARTPPALAGKSNRTRASIDSIAPTPYIIAG